MLFDPCRNELYLMLDSQSLTKGGEPTIDHREIEARLAKIQSTSPTV
ncbi:hypothetical protein D187_000473 [Cystobacter fuscus DSM 2262]|uniref:Uncharacterized protein n=1 Tax=Cystobacter fuscus (strain ATCC 25194 / DSM 2262 / NBRC 100088 / M29) TaxID=1242864 RepID=S9R7N0_CYSF2|nr:hypothetical protein D187_000473 [Cystobacter fuscus DSM 2262]